MGRFGGLAALLQGLAITMFFTAMGVLLLTQGAAVDDFQNPERLLTLAATHPATLPLLSILDGVYLTDAVLSLIIMGTLVEQIRSATLSQKILTCGGAVISSALFLGSATFDLYSLHTFARLFAYDPEQALARYRLHFLVTFQGENAAAAAYGVSIMLMSSISWRHRVLPRPLALLGILWGTISVLSWPVYLIGALGPIGIVWCGWLGTWLLRGHALRTHLSKTFPNHHPVSGGDQTLQ